jgi:ABC-type multidrug transport system ATPase subunit
MPSLPVRDPVGDHLLRPSRPPAVRVGGVVKRFGSTTALAGVDLEVPEGMVFGLLGPKGAGKTTLIRILATLLEPDTGRVELLGHDVVAESASVRELLALTGQFAAVDELGVGQLADLALGVVSDGDPNPVRGKRGFVAVDAVRAIEPAGCTVVR